MPKPVIACRAASARPRQSVAQNKELVSSQSANARGYAAFQTQSGSRGDHNHDSLSGCLPPGRLQASLLRKFRAKGFQMLAPDLLAQDLVVAVLLHHKIVKILVLILQGAIFTAVAFETVAQGWVARPHISVA
jgi:hypothetical protein